MQHPDENRVSDERRKFLKFAAITPPAVTFLLSTSLHSKAIAKSGGKASTRTGKPGHGFGDTNRSHSGPPGQLTKTIQAKTKGRGH